MPVDESNHVNPVSPHAVAKLAGDLYLRAYAEMYGLAPICLVLASENSETSTPAKHRAYSAAEAECASAQDETRGRHASARGDQHVFDVGHLVHRSPAELA